MRSGPTRGLRPSGAAWGSSGSSPAGRRAGWDDRSRVTLADRLRERITREGPISFRDFMATALYDPQEGYYAKRARIGERGDFVTSPHISPAFAAEVA